MANSNNIKIDAPPDELAMLASALGHAPPEAAKAVFGDLVRPTAAPAGPILAPGAPLGSMTMRRFGSMGPEMGPAAPPITPMRGPMFGAIRPDPSDMPSHSMASLPDVPPVTGAPASPSFGQRAKSLFGKIGSGIISAALPGFATFIPGTEEHKMLEEHLAERKAQAGAELDKTAAETQEEKALAAKNRFEIAPGAPAQTPEDRMVHAVQMGYAQDSPEAKEYALTGKLPPEKAAKTLTPEEELLQAEQGILDPNASAGQKTQFQRTIDAAKAMKGMGDKPPEEEKAISDREVAEGLQDSPENRDRVRGELQTQKREPKDTTARDLARSDRSYQYNSTRIADIAKDPMARAERLSRVGDTLDQNTPQADALVAPELLSVMAGGQGSGVRMNEAEISRIVGGRTNWESLKAKLDAWRTDNSKGFALTPTQREQTRALFKVVQERNNQRLKAISDAQDKLTDSDDPKDHRKIYNDLTKALQAVNEGKTNAQNPSGATPTGADNEVLVGGKVVGHTVNGKYVPLAK